MDHKQFGRFIGETRRQRGYTQKQLADILFVTDKAVSKWECGLGFPDVKTLQPLAAALGVSLAELLDGKRYDADTVPASEANRLIASTLGLVKSELSSVKKNIRTMLLLGVILLFFLINLAMGYVFEWMLGNTISFAYPHLVLRIVRHIVSAIALLIAGLMLLRTKWLHWAAPVSIACSLLAAMCNVVMLLCIWYFFPEDMTMLEYVRLGMFLLTMLCLALSFNTMCRSQYRSAMLMLSAACAGMLLGILLEFLIPGTKPAADAICVRALSLAAPMGLSALCIRPAIPTAAENGTDNVAAESIGGWDLAVEHVDFSPRKARQSCAGRRILSIFNGKRACAPPPGPAHPICAVAT